MTLLTADAPYALVVDDDFVIRMDAIDILEQAGFQVLDAEHGGAAFSLLKLRHLCQSASKKDPLSACNRDPLST